MQKCHLVNSAAVNPHPPNNRIKLACFNPVLELALNQEHSPVLTHTENLLVNKGGFHGNSGFVFLLS